MSCADTVLPQGRAESLRKEMDMLKLVESRLTQEKETMQTQQRGQNMLLTNLKTIEVPTDTHTPISKQLIHRTLTTHKLVEALFSLRSCHVLTVLPVCSFRPRWSAPRQTPGSV